MHQNQALQTATHVIKGIFKTKKAKPNANHVALEHFKVR